jgi:hypothetical protein
MNHQLSGLIKHHCLEEHVYSAESDIRRVALGTTYQLQHPYRYW